MVNVTWSVSVVPRASLTVIVDRVRPARVGVPVTVPSALSTIPAGSVSAEYAYGSRPPVAFTPQLNGVVSFMFTGTGCVVIGAPAGARPRSSGARTNSESCFVSLFGEPFAWAVNVKTPLWVGVPEMTPFDPSVRPVGSVPPASDQELTVPPEALSAGAVYAWPRFPSGRPVVATTSRWPRRADVDHESIVRRRLADARGRVVRDREVEVVASGRRRRSADGPSSETDRPGGKAPDETVNRAQRSLHRALLGR